MAKKKITIEDLAVMTQKGFEEMHERFKEVDKQFEAVDKRFDHIDKRFDKIENGILARHDREIELFRDRILKIETTIRKK